MPATPRRSDLLKHRLKRFTRMLPGVERGDTRSIHRARVASRRLRELLPVLQLDHNTARKLSRRLRNVTTRLGTVRELDVLLLLIDELHVSRREHANPLRHVAAAVAAARSAARTRLFERLPIRDMRRLAEKLNDVADALREQESSSWFRRAGAPRRAAWRWAVDARVARRALRLSTAMRHAGSVYLPERLHEVRLSLKKLRYSAELATQIAGGKTTPELRTLKAGQDVLGRMHDLQILIDRVRQAQATLTPPSVPLWRALGALVSSLDDDCRRLHARYMRARPELEAISERLSGRGRASVRGVAMRPRASAG